MATDRIQSVKRSVEVNRKKVTKLEEDLKDIKSKIKVKAPRPTIIISNNELAIRKTTVEPNFTTKTVLTDSTWHYVEMYFKRKQSDKKNKKRYEEALNYWSQSKNFFIATENLDILSKPLTTYYCFLNATKALLTCKSVAFDTKHGVSGKRIDSKSNNLNNEIIFIHPSGVLSGLCNYLKQPVRTSPQNRREEYTLKDILYNLEFIHRAYNMTYTNQPELFIPVEEPRFVHEKSLKKGWIETKLEPQYSNKTTLSKLKGFEIDPYYDNSDGYVIRIKKRFKWNAPRNKPNAISGSALRSYYQNHRNRFRYIYSANKLWYIKRADLDNSHIIDRNSLILMFGAMHRLSEMSRYDPNTLDKHLSGKAGWLISEFITKSIYQFIDMISSEITGDDFRVTGFRT
ncbi:YaaC family protein [Priestia megaterium]|uniref:YaaC family protein n=1 Tax=Priestia megaterium TaxID=1404 RepID=UPI001FB54398|nr:YaaC family protein [Priestia megaterium]